MQRKQQEKTMASLPMTPEKVYRVEFDREDDGRWIAEVPALPGVLAYGKTRNEALARVQALAYRVVADKIEAAKKPQPTLRFAVA
jgi:predicted RNase H-like HicB family nuclease